MLNYRFVNKLTARLTGRDHQLWIRILVIIGLFAYTMFMALRASRMIYPLEIVRDPLLLVIPAVAAAYILLRWPGLGLLAIVVGALALPFSIGTGSVSSLHAAILLTGAMMGLAVYQMVVEKKTFTIIRLRPVLAILVFVGFAGLSFLVGQLPWFVFAQPAPLTAQLGGLGIFALSAGAFLLTAYHVRDIRWLKWMVWIYLVLGAVYIFGELFSPTRAFVSSFIQRGAYSNSVFWIWLVVLAFSQTFFNSELSKEWRVAIGILLLASIYYAIVEQGFWTSGWLPPLVGVAAMLLLSRTVWSWLAIFMGVAMGIAKLDAFQRLLFGGGNEYSLFTRVEAWKILGEIIQRNPLLGLGPANYYWYTPLYPILGYAVQFNSHNNYVDIIAQTGLLGLLAFLWFAGELAWLGYRLLDKVPTGFARSYAFAALGGLVATLTAGMLGDWFFPFVYNIGLNGFRASIVGWLFLGGLVALHEMNQVNLEGVK